MSYYVTNENSVLNINNAHLKVSGNIQTDVMKLGAIEFAPPASDVAGTVNFTNVTTGVTTSSNLNVGGTLMLGTVEVVATTHTLENTTALGNVTSNTVQFTNATTGLVATGNVEASKFIGDGSLLTGITTIESNVDLIRNTNNTAFINLNSNVVVEFPRSKRVIKYPKVALTQNALNNGYTVTSSTQESSSRAAWKVFNNAYAEGNGWRGTGTYSTSDGSFTGTWVDFSSGSQTISTYDRGDWLQIILPEKIRLEAIRLQPRLSTSAVGGLPSYGRSEFIRNGAIWGSNDGSSWDKVYTINSVLPPEDTSMMTFNGINSTTAYNYFVLVITHTSGTSTGTLASFSEWELYGTPEYDPDAHGTDVTVKSYPNVPNTDWLDVYYDGQDYTQMPETVDNKTGVSTYDATPSGGVGFDSTYNAFTFNLSSNQYLSTSTPMSGNYVHSISMWFKPNSLTAGSGDALFYIGATSGSSNYKCELFMETDRINYTFGGNNFQAYPTIENGKWYHITVTYNGVGGQSGREIYLNSVKLSATHSISGGALNLTNGNLDIGRYTPDSTYDFDGSIANFRLFNRVLTSDEIYQLYAYQKEYFGHGRRDMSMTLKAGRLGIGTSEPRSTLDVRGDVRGSDNVIIGPYGEQWWRLYTFQHNGNLGFIGEDGTEHGYLVGSGTENNLDFTGQHRAVVDKINVSNYESLEGLIVSANKNKYINVDKDITTGSNAIQISQSLPVVSLSNVVHDKACYGVIAGSEDLDSRTYEQGTFVSVFQKQKGDTRAFINSLGEGAIWVVNTNGSLESGDYITTSNIVGYGQKQDDDVLHNFTVAKITMDCDFEPVTQSVQIIKKDEEGENVLDEHGQIQWEDHPTETEKAYKIRYLDASGVETDEASAVHKAAFVGCTYHCG
jgi:hypothetical protein